MTPCKLAWLRSVTFLNLAFRRDAARRAGLSYPVCTIQPVVKWFDNRFDNRLYRVNGALATADPRTYSFQSPFMHHCTTDITFYSAQR